LGVGVGGGDWGHIGCGDREGVVVEDVMDDVNFLLVFGFFEAVGV